MLAMRGDLKLLPRYILVFSFYSYRYEVYVYAVYVVRTPKVCDYTYRAQATNYPPISITITYWKITFPF